MYKPYERFFNLPEEPGWAEVEFKENLETESMEMISGNQPLNAVQLRFIADEMEKLEGKLKQMRARYEAFVCTDRMSSDEGREMLKEFEEGELDPYFEDDGMELFRRLEEEGDLLDNYCTDTGNAYSGDTEKKLYGYRSRYYVVDRINLSCDEYGDYDTAREEGGFKR